MAISVTQRDANPEVSYAGVVPNGIDVDNHPFRADKDDYLIFVGRCNADKGPELAVEVARRAGRRLVMVLKRSEPHEVHHWESEVEPVLTGTETILEDLPHDEVVSLMAGATAMVFPIRWPEPFGLVMAEAMACGTPVVTRPLGAAQEIVADGETGYLRDGVDELARAVADVERISPHACRERAARHCSGRAMVDGYERLYEAACARPTVMAAGG
ncbi:MAG TPA: glycosyltransferase [Acidimicrobiales bacterium]|nr:glycosyltransferase [Acidimicrobiales bacterium]